MDRLELEKFSDIDYERLCSGAYAVVSKYYIAYGDTAFAVPEIGDSLTLKNEEGIARCFEVIGLVDGYPHHLSERVCYSNSWDVILAHVVFLDFFGAVQPMQVNIAYSLYYAYYQLNSICFSIICISFLVMRSRSQGVFLAVSNHFSIFSLYVFLS